MEQFAQLGSDMVRLWSQYSGSYLNGIKNTLILAVVATLIGCLIGFVCGVLNTIPYTKSDSLPKRFLLKLIRIIVRVYVEIFGDSYGAPGGVHLLWPALFQQQRPAV
ncbi:MAG: hypothetical protein ACLS43_01240 [Evtepia gabavorous]